MWDLSPKRFPLYTCTLWKCVPVWTAVELLVEGQLLVALALHNCTHAGTGQNAWWWYWQNLFRRGTRTEGSTRQGKDPPELSQKENAHRKGCFAFQSSLPEPFAFHFPAPQTRWVVHPLLPRDILCAHTNATGSLWGTRGILRNKTVLKERRQSSEQHLSLTVQSWE